MNLNGGLTVSCGGVYLALLYRDGGVAVDDAVEYAAERLDTERQRSNVEQQQILDLAAENACLNSRADGYALIGVDALEGLLADEVLDSLLDCGDTGRTADEQHACRPEQR